MYAGYEIHTLLDCASLGLAPGHQLRHPRRLSPPVLCLCGHTDEKSSRELISQEIAAGMYTYYIYNMYTTYYTYICIFF